MKMYFRKLLLVGAATLSMAAGASTRVNVAITSVSGRSVFLDRGSNSGIVTGLRVLFFRPGGPPVEGVVMDVATRSCRVELNQGAIALPIGTQGQMEVPSESDAAAPSTSSTSTAPAIPAHPPWSRPGEARTDDMPLLAPNFSVPATARPTTYHGRVYSDFGLTLDHGSGANNKYWLGRAGTAVTVTNPFGQGGTFQFQGEYDYRNAEIGGIGSSESHDAIIQRASYTIGDERDSRARLEVGRFYSFYLPELGLVDGAEGAIRLENGLTFGAALGAYPRPFPNRQEGEDIGFHTFVSYNPPNQQMISGTIGYQKTWHNLGPDRDLLVGHGSIWITKELWIYGSARADIYGSSDKLKGPGPQLTDAWLQARYTPDPTRGIAASYSHYSWADIKQNEFGLLPPDLIQHGKVDRIEVSAWRDLAPNLRPTVRVNYFSDYKGSGYGGQLDLDWTNIRGKFDLHGDAFYNRGSYTDDMGFRLEARMHADKCTLYTGYELYRYGTRGTFQTGGDFIRHTLRAGVNWQQGNMYYNIAAERYFGDRDDAYGLRAYVEYRF